MNRRFMVKKAARHGVALTSLLSGSLSLRRRLRGPRVRVLTYHRFGHERDEAFAVAPQVFERQVRWLSDRGLVISLDQLTRYVAGDLDLPDRACLITIDDGCVSTLTEALPILARHSVPAVAFVTASLVGAEYQGLPERYLRWDELREVADSGVITIGSHAHRHRSLGLMPIEEARREAVDSKAQLEDELSREVSSFAYPFGTRSDFGPATERALADAGYRVAFNSMHGAVRPGMDPISLPRVKVEGGELGFMFPLTARGAMDPWRAIDQNLWRLQRVRKEIG